MYSDIEVLLDTLDNLGQSKCDFINTKKDTKMKFDEYIGSKLILFCYEKMNYLVKKLKKDAISCRQ